MSEPVNHDIQDFLAEYEGEAFPHEFLTKYEPMECLSQNELGETLLVKSVSTGIFCVCKRCLVNGCPVPEEGSRVLRTLLCKGVPSFVESFVFEGMLYTIREYVEGESLQRFLERENMSDEQAISVAIQLCDTLVCLHGQNPPVIHRDIKPSNVIINNGKVVLIDFGISRTFDEKADTDTVYFGTRDYAPPEQYGFSQTDNRADIFSLGVLLRFILTGSTKPGVPIKNKRLERIIKKCTSLAPESRYASVQILKKDLLKAYPKYMKRQKAVYAVLALVIIAGIAFGTVKYKEYSQRTIWPVDTPAYISSQDKIEESVQDMNEQYSTDVFNTSDDMANIGYLKELLINVFGFDGEYIKALPPDGSIPAENNAFFYPWGFPDDENIHRDILTYTVVKTYWPEVVADWSSLKDDTGQYPGVRVANAFAEENKLLEGMNKQDHITFGEAAIVYANAKKVYDAMK